ncbi:hypothetical protein AMJ57_05160 [Parcubacteria bacterium SG8_24]|nr:MAG: hypothetical protein AMJ57_05160 [Parcubacteria bacterium SG8_24]
MPTTRPEYLTTMAKKRKFTLGAKRITRLVTISVMVLALAEVVFTVLVVIRTLEALDETVEAGGEGSVISQINNDKLGHLLDLTEAKMALDEPRAGELFNPFDEPVLPPPPPPPAEENVGEAGTE